MKFPNFVLLAAPLLSLFATSSREGPPPVLDTRRYASPSSRFVLEVDPTHRQGSGPARYRFLRDGGEVWSVERRFTFWEAVVTDEGVSAGYAYADGIRGADRNEFVVAVLGADGEVVATRACERPLIAAMCPMPEVVSGMFLDSNGGNFVVRVRDGALFPRETWWTFRLLDGAEIGKVDPMKYVPEMEERSSIQGAASVPGTPLTLVHMRRDLTAARFVLLDAGGKLVWSSDIVGDYARIGDRERLRHWAWMKEGGAIVVGNQAGRFGIRSIAERTTGTFQVEADPGSPVAWRVEEIAREPFAPSFEDPPEPPFPSIRLRKLETVEFDSGSGAPPSPIRDVLAFDFDSQGRFEVIRRKGKGEPGPTWCLVERDGTLVRETRFPPVRGDTEARIHWLRISDERWLATASGFGIGASAKAWWADTRTGKFAEIEGFDCLPIEKLARDDGGGFVALANRTEEYGMTPFLLAFDAQGRKRWALEGMGNVVTKDPARLFSPSSVAVAGDGTVVVTDSIRKSIQLFQATGEFTRAISLAESWGEARYPSHVVSAGEGEFLVHDSGGGENRIWRMHLDGKVVSSFAPRHADGHSPAPKGGSICVAPDGELWTTDGEMLQRLGSAGTVDEVVGNVPDTVNPSEFEDPFVDSLGRILALDRRSRVVQVFDREGHRRGICRFEPEDSPVPNPFADPGDGSVFVRVQGNQYVQFDERGTRLGRRMMSTEAIPRRCVFRPGSKERWFLVGYLGDCLIHSADDSGVVSSRPPIQRRPDGKWLRGIRSVSVAADGTLYVLDGSSMSLPEVSAALCILPADGGEERMIELPRKSLGNDLAVLKDWIAFGSSGSVHVMNRASGEIALVDLDLPAGAKTSIDTFASPDGDELWVIERTARTLTRYAVP